ncbi:hypothetical protein EUTSA_v10027338mg [Eutrema salsugineum]|uniref:Uncharacterized protein n=1 Tax=Eutrema salsugineum TaxID=72664 RepID=V4LYI9_EUTSA|nr:hypothetical protein EUTSA_v10027338mg [Eutrema salsugineum]
MDLEFVSSVKKLSSRSKMLAPMRREHICGLNQFWGKETTFHYQEDSNDLVPQANSLLCCRDNSFFLYLVYCILFFFFITRSHTHS